MDGARGDTDTALHDGIVIGAGLCGIIFLAYARRAGLRCIALEKQDDVGGLWSRLPSWQDIQNRRQDIALDGVPLDGVDQPAVHRYAREWVRRFALAPHIHLGREVTSVAWIDGAWTVRTRRGALRARHLVVASGVQNEPWIPDVERADSAIVETHSAELERPGDLAGERVTVVGGGASSQDLLELALTHGARDVHWVYRSIRWFLPTRRPKQRAWPNLRELGLSQGFQTPATVSAVMRWILRLNFRRLGVQALAPEEPFDFARHQLIPGRATVLANLDAIARHRGEVRSLRGNEVTLESGERFETDRVLWGTGYRMELSYLGLPEYQGIRRARELLPRLGCLVRSLDHPNLFFVGMTLINSTSSTPFLAAVEAKTIVSHMRGDCEIPPKPLSHHLTYRELPRYFAQFDRGSYSRLWRLKQLWKGLWYAVFQGRSVRVA